MVNIIELAKQCPGTIISVRVEDLVNANARLIADAKNELEQSVALKKEMSFLTRDDVVKRLNVAPTTLWRWAKSGYLVPVNVGGQRRYKSVDVNAILEGKR